MPFYQVYHTYPLAGHQRQAIATSITNLHCKAFDTPSFFVHVNFIKQEDAPAEDTYFMAGKPHSSNSNRVVAVVRTSPNRTKAHWDKLSADIEDAWDEVVQDKSHGSEKGARDRNKSLLMVVFTPTLAVREGGMAIPEAGHETEWLKKQLPYFKNMSEKHGLQEFTDMLEEFRHRGLAE
ncbi:hypothetical protein GQ607_008645 [Colletotrichum asianum]|uniref:Tautomerase cis-CaaD-like domain-containing protein n=1 Tax=Colletotrichum asianum TaxID=702518 RepID=A0A8H3WDG3_9PEZI|nr:hypothetical protein GQ607_008645 [Colletotrichum asianum]